MRMGIDDDDDEDDDDEDEEDDDDDICDKYCTVLYLIM